MAYRPNPTYRISRVNTWVGKQPSEVMKPDWTLLPTVYGVEGTSDSFFDVRVINPYARSNRTENTQAMLSRHDNMKRRAFEQRIREV